MDTISGNFLLGVLVNGVSALIGILLGYLVRDRYYGRRYSNWRVEVLQGGERKVNRPISWEKARQIHNESSELSAFLKGVVSPYDQLNCDIIEQGESLDLLTIKRMDARVVDWLPDFKLGKWQPNHRIEQTYIIDADKNPPKKDGQKKETLSPL